jgi:hypothetical protein
MAQVIDYTPPPAPPDRQPDEALILYGARLVQYLIAHETAGRLTEEQLETADHAITWLLARQPLPDEQISPFYWAGLRAAEHLIERARHYRALDAADARAALTAQTGQAPQAPTNRDGGTRQPAPPFPPRLPQPSATAAPSTRNPQPAIDF